MCTSVFPPHFFHILLQIIVLTQATNSAPSPMLYSASDDIFARQKLSYLNYFSLCYRFGFVVELFVDSSRLCGMTRNYRDDESDEGPVFPCPNLRQAASHPGK